MFIHHYIYFVHFVMQGAAVPSFCMFIHFYPQSWLQNMAYKTVTLHFICKASHEDKPIFEKNRNRSWLTKASKFPNLQILFFQFPRLPYGLWLSVNITRWHHIIAQHQVAPQKGSFDDFELLSKACIQAGGSRWWDFAWITTNATRLGNTLVIRWILEFTYIYIYESLTVWFLARDLSFDKKW